MKKHPLLYTALKDRPKIFQLITICLVSFFLSIIVVSLVAAAQKDKGDRSKSPEIYASGINTKPFYAK